MASALVLIDHWPSSKANMLSAKEHPAVITDYLSKELQRGRTLPTQMAPTQVSRFGVIPKRHLPREWLLIVDLSAPDGLSVNNGISHYLSVQSVARHVYQVGKGALIVKMEIKSAFRVVPVNPDDRMLLGMMWDNVKD